METLPLELREEIFLYLLPRICRTQVVSVPVSSKAERTDIYNLRLTSRRVNTGASQAFLAVIGDIPTGCREQSVQNLTNLVGLADVGNHITCLAFNTCKLYITEKQTLRQINQTCYDRCQWIAKSFCSEVLAILRKTSRLRHLICLPEATRGSEVLRFGVGHMVLLEVIVKDMYDPMQYIQEALEATALNETLETLTVLTASFEGFLEEPTSLRKAKPLHLPKLKHLTLSPSYHDISRFAVYCPNITSWHTVLDSRAETFDLIPSQTAGDSIQMDSSLRSYTISAKGQYIQTSTLVRSIAAATDRFASIPILVVRDLIILFDINYDVHPLPGEGRFKELVFENSKYCCTDEITLSGPSEPKELDSKWRALPRLCERAGRVRLKTGMVDRVIERSEWQGVA
ncbi:uncharacterized protein K460DRAFT_419042 [Cucurbitaria berberidis CBS 394.84]|uniref:Uncharacterized protein n=1 Tax=Cucurbitaria berberidis CBS 394.84 TaxID=1168544 RepID=A0A9P4GEM0_9PLEO|nr:uncharacterized protein K460DRAFT_419042 [Cucurbitaria berberidis CBS 394.84]KAF1844081.1 hypothetical protein K460DRAFT_419042 [Cucurbitaria berberidis CBS 394.84]